MDGASDKIGPQNPINLSGTNADLGDASANVAASADHLNNTIGIPRKSSSIRNEFLPISPGSRIEARSSEDSNPESSPSKSPSTLNGRDTQDVKEEGQNGSIDKRRTESIPSSGHEIRAAVSPGDEDWSNLQQILSNIFGRARQAVSEEEQTRHVGVIWRNLTVKGVGVGATLQPTNSDLILGPFRFLWRLVTGKARRKKPVRTILDDLTGCVKPGEMLLVLGQPGAGCSTFLKVLGNQRAGYESVEGKVTYGGADAETMAKKYRSEVLYNPEDDLHSATLTVRQTLNFAITTRTPGKSSRKPGESRRQYRRVFLKSVAKLFWIEHCLDTKIGNAIIRGVSGGEKKRVSIAEALITKASTQCWDNSTRGLDASTAQEYVQSLRSLTNMTNVSTLVAIYQASESLYKLFDRVILLIEGKCAYFGPASDAKAYFESLGFIRPPRWTTPDFITSVAEPHARKVKPGWEDRIPRSAAQFKKAYDESEVRKRTLETIEEFEEEQESHKDELEEIRRRTPKKNFTIPYWRQVLALSRRQFLVTIGDKQSLLGKWGVILFLALIVGSLFYDLPKTSQGVFTRGGVLFYIILFNALLSMAELTAIFESRPILMKHKSFSFYRPSAHALAQVVVDVPQVFVQVFIFLIIVYFMANLARTASQFFIALLFVWLVTMTMYSFFRAIGALVTSLDAATRITGVAIQALVVYTGYLIPPGKMRPWLKWLIWINPVQYTFESLMANEFYNLRIACVGESLVPQGPNASPQFQSCTVQGSRPGETYVDGAAYIQSNYGYTRHHLWRNFGIIISLLVLFIALTMLGTELQASSRSSAHEGAAVTVYMKGQEPPEVKHEMEEKKGGHDEEGGNQGTVSTGSEPGPENNKEAHGIARNTAIFTWQNVNYYISAKGGKKKLLQDVQGYVKPGRLTALMGASGAGKTTLLNVLAQRIDFGVVTGSFLIDGKPLPKSFQRDTGYAEQADIHEPTTTVRESLRFSAFLRRPPDVPLEEKYEYCERILDLLELQPIAGAIIGQPGAGLNQEQRKRVTIAVELASKPDLLLFLDEPTSGLDSLAAFNIVRFLRKLASVGQAVLCTIHQPSAVLFDEFDDLLLLQSGGRVVFHGELGPDSRRLIEYFECHEAKPCPPDANPAEYMLDVIGAGDPNYEGPDWADIWASSPENQALTNEIQQIVESKRHEKQEESPGDEREFAMPLRTQIFATVKRSFKAYWRTPNYTVGKFMLHIWTGLFNTFTFWHIRDSVIDMQSRLFSIFLSLVIAPPLIQQLQPRYLHFRGLYEAREEKSKIYSWFALITSVILPELPYSVVAGTLYFCCWYFGTWFPRNSFAVGYTWMMFMVFEVFYVSFGQMIASISPNELFASLLVPAFFTFVVSFCGVVVPYRNMPYFWRSWMYWLTPFRYLLEGYLGVATNRVPVRCSDNEFARFRSPGGTSCQQYAGPFASKAGGYVTTRGGLCAYCPFKNGNEFARSFNVFYKYKWRDYGIFWSYVVFNILAVYLLSWFYLHGFQALKRKLSWRKLQKVR